MKVRWKTITLGFLASLGVILYLHPNIDLKARHFIDSLFTNKRDAIDLPNSAIAKEEVGLNKAQRAHENFDMEKFILSVDGSSDPAAYRNARAILFEYSRSGNPPDLQRFLTIAREKKLISPNEYYGELGHMLDVPGGNVFLIFKEIVKSQNSYGLEVMFSAVANSPSWIKDINPAERLEMYREIYFQKPKFPGDVSQIGLSDVSRYENWLTSAEVLHGEKDFLGVVENLINKDSQDPREYFALISLGYYDRLLSENKIDSAKTLKKIASDYISSYPKNEVANIIYKRHMTN